jgi:hypothetical protein
LNKSKLPGHCIFPLANLQKGASLGFVPDDNIVNNLEELCIRRSNLKFAKFHKSWANAKKIGYPNLFARLHQLPTLEEA